MSGLLEESIRLGLICVLNFALGEGRDCTGSGVAWPKRAFGLRCWGPGCRHHSDMQAQANCAPTPFLARTTIMSGQHARLYIRTAGVGVPMPCTATTAHTHIATVTCPFCTEDRKCVFENAAEPAETMAGRWRRGKEVSQDRL